ncbi:aldehyde dehydrogenase family protein [Streptomyces broussonetiae]|uniref:Aldehyde dehydrogenase family protein n=1 Tax=Streptomyces broussonetiae TaxID=2686304 RepID=A0A6I6NIL7_9ACTN|nr:aldehyde dehydrogenase family protein [Streptomyces broussonetiae]
MVGPLVSRRQRERVLDYIKTGLNEGARLTTGGGPPPGLDRGWFVEPTVFADVENSSTIAQEEIFGPVLTVTPYDSEDEAVCLANESAYGLAGTVWATDLDHGAQVARRMRTGTVGLNGYLPDLNSPYGGRKASGLGSELGPEGLQAYPRRQGHSALRRIRQLAPAAAPVGHRRSRRTARSGDRRPAPPARRRA